MIRSQAAPEAPPAGWGAYAAAAILSVTLCLAGGRLGEIGAASLEFSGWTLPSGRAILLFAAMWAACLAMLLLFPRGLTRRRRLLAILVPALLCRLLLLPLAPSDDLNRCLWEGRVVRNGVNPYLHPPDDPALSALARQDPFHGGINHPDIPAVYPPLMLLAFSCLSRLGATPMAVKSVMTLFDLGALVLLIRLLSHRGLDERWAALYAFNPVVLYAFAGQGHLDAAQNLLLLCALRLYDQKRWGWMFFAAGLAVQTKYVAVLTLPFLVNRENLGRLWAILPAAGLPFLPFLAEGPGRIFNALAAFGTQFAVNGSVHGLLRWALGGIAPATTACQGIMVIAMVFGCLRLHPRRNPRCFDDPVSGCFFALGAVLLLSPTVHFWYVAWIVPFLALRPFASWMVLCLTIGFGFTADGYLHLTGRWHLPAWAAPAAWLPFWALFSRDVRLFLKRLGTPVDPALPTTVSVVIPARNEGDQVADCVSAVLRDRRVVEAIVVDGGSADDTAVQAERAGARVIRHPAPPENGGGRGGQIGAGVAAAAGDVIAVVHADIRITEPAFGQMIDLLRRQPMIVGGAVGGRFRGRGWRLRLLETANDLRAAFLGISFGDQVQFFRRRPVVENGLYPSIPLMEDVELSLRLQGLGRTAFLFGEAWISPRRWRANVSRRAGLVIRLFLTYLWQRGLGRRPDTLAMYIQYYGKER